MRKLAAALLLLLLAAPSLGAGAPDTGYKGLGMADVGDAIGVTTFVDVTGSSNPCAAIQSAINPFLVGTATNLTVKVVGDATIDWSDTVVQKANDLNPGPAALVDAPYRVCVSVIPTTIALNNGYPVIDTTKVMGTAVLTDILKLNIDFDATLKWDATGQTDTVVLWHDGPGWLAGFDAAGAYQSQMTNAVRYTGRLSIQGAADVDTGWTEGQIHELSGANFLAKVDGTAATTTTVFWMTSGTHRQDNTDFSFYVRSHSTDNDDIGMIHFESWGNHFQGLYISGFNTGYQTWGTHNGSIYNSVIATNDINFVCGDHAPVATNLAVWSESLEAGSVHTKAIAPCQGISVWNSIMESGPWGALVMFGGQRAVFNNSFFETATLSSHGMLIGAGVCTGGGGRDGMVCGWDDTAGADLECPGAGTCSFSTGNSSYQQIIFNGGTTPGDASNETWSGLYFGEDANASSVSESITFNNVTHSGEAQYDNECTAAGVPYACCSNVRAGTCKMRYGRSSDNIDSTVNFIGSMWQTSTLDPGQTFATYGSPAVASEIVLCGELPNAATSYLGPAVAAWSGDATTSVAIGSAGCDALGDATEATADAPLLTSRRFRATGLYCKVSSNPANDVVFTARSGAANMGPYDPANSPIVCTVPGSGASQECMAKMADDVPITAGATIAVRAVTTEDLSAQDGWCKLFFTIQ